MCVRSQPLCLLVHACVYVHTLGRLSEKASTRAFRAPLRAFSVVRLALLVRSFCTCVVCVRVYVCSSLSASPPLSLSLSLSLRLSLSPPPPPAAGALERRQNRAR